MTVPTYVDMERLCEETCLAERTVWTLLKRGEFPAPHKIGRKHLWKWKEVERYIEGKHKGPRTAEDVFHATQTAVSKSG